MLDKTSEQWKKIPLWVRVALCLVTQRRDAVRLELVTACLAGLLLIFVHSTLWGAMALIGAFVCAGAIKWVDNADLWDQRGP